MKTGRRRKKAETPESPQPSPAKPARPAARTTRPRPKRVTRRKLSPALIILPILFALIVLIVGAVICSTCLGPRAKPSVYLPATASGSWVTTVKVLAPELTSTERFRSDCEADAKCRVIPGTCTMREREDEFTERVVDDYDDYAYTIYYEELAEELYEAAGDSFEVTQLNADEDRWEGDLHYISQEWLDTGTCQYTNYTVWITDPQDDEDEIEVVLSECEVWDHVIVKERVYEEEEYCKTENEDMMVAQETLTRQGTGADVAWGAAVAPAGGEVEREFEGTVIFRADGVEHTAKVTDEGQYLRYLAVPHYVGVDDEGEFIRLTDQAP